LKQTRRSAARKHVPGSRRKGAANDRSAGQKPRATANQPQAKVRSSARASAGQTVVSGIGRPSAGAAIQAQQPGKGKPPLKMGRIKGEWMEIRLPDKLAGAPMSAVLSYLPLPPKLIAKLMHSKGLLLSGVHLRIRLFPREQRDYPSDWMELNILYEDEFTLVVNKPAGIEVHPSEKGQRRTLAHGVAAYYEMSGQDVRIRHIHRIDKETTGPVLYAKNEFAHYQYDKDMREKKIERIYLALAEGVIPQDKGTINMPIGQDRHHSTRRRVSETGEPAVTHYEVVERFADHTLVRLRLETGRTHQIRVHMSAIGHPLAGDGMYGGTRRLMQRQALHGEQLIWRHPWTGEKQQVRAPLPDDFYQALQILRGNK
jgi:23S rRNA pseudouridine1911/1915/1917 synthase